MCDTRTLYTCLRRVCFQAAALRVLVKKLQYVCVCIYVGVWRARGDRCVSLSARRVN